MKATYKQQLVKIKHYLKWFAIPVLLLCSLVLPPAKIALAAGSATLSLSPSSGSYALNGTLSVTIHEYSTDQINAVEADLTYDQAKLQFASIDDNSSAFDLTGPKTGGSGSVKIARAKSSTSLTGDQVVASVNFTVLAGSGTTSISFANSSQIVRTSDTQDVWNHNANSSTYTLTGASSGGTSTPPATGGTTPTTQKTTTKSTAKTTPSSNTTPSTPAPVTTATAPAGYYVAIKVTDTKNKPVSNAVVTIDTQKVSTDTTGLASFISVSAGQHTVSVSAKGKTKTQSITVTAGPASAVQIFPVTLNLGTSTLVRYLWYVGGGILLILLLGGGGGLLRGLMMKRRQSQFYAKGQVDMKPVEPPVVGAIPGQESGSSGMVVGSFDSGSENNNNKLEG